MNISLNSIFTKNLNKKQILEICKLKDSHWKFGLNEQVNFFKKKCKKYDIHNLLYFNSKIIGYTTLGKRTYYDDSNIKKKYILFNTLIIHKKFRKKNFSSMLMTFNNDIIKKQNLFAFLICKNPVVNFYKKNGWNKLSKKCYSIKNKFLVKNGLIYNNKNYQKSYLFNLNM